MTPGAAPAPTLLRLLVQAGAGTAALAFALFGGAGTLAWAAGWAFVALFVGSALAIGLRLRRTDPALLDARLRSPFAPAQRLRDRAVMAAITLAFWLWLAAMALDARRLAWSHVPAVLQGLGGALVAGAFAGWARVLRENTFAAITIEVQSARGHRVVSSGPYAVVRHPMYAWALLFVAGTPLLLGSWWGLLGLPVFAALLVARIRGEEALLADGLAGYREYMATVRRRLLPGVW